MNHIAGMPSWLFTALLGFIVSSAIGFVFAVLTVARWGVRKYWPQAIFAVGWPLLVVAFVGYVAAHS